MTKALTLTQPWATAVALGVKRVETRSWSTGYHGPLLIHAAQAMDIDACAMAAHLRDLGLVDVPVELLPRGAIVARCRLVRVMGTVFVTGLSPTERLLGDYSAGRFAWLLADVEPIDPPIPWRGALGLWEGPS